MIIAIDGNEANIERKVGIGEYAFELLQQFSKCTIYNVQFTIYLKDKPRPEMPKESENWKYKVFGPRKYWTQFALPARLFIERKKPDVFFSPSHYGPRFCPVSSAISIMDISYILYPGLFAKKDLYQLKNWTAYSVKNASKIFTISQSSKDGIIKTYQIPEERVIVTYPGIKTHKIMVRSQEELKTQNSKLITKYGIEHPFILFVGTLQPRKNIERLIEAFSMFRHSEPAFSEARLWRLGSESSKKGMPKQVRHDIQLIIVGKKGWLFEPILEAPKKFGIADKVKFLDFVTDGDLPLFYQNAEMFVLPSLYEGFGLPVLEAMQYGCPVITSNVSSLPEAAGDAALYVDPENVADIAEKMKSLLGNKKLQKELVEKGYQQIKKFSWKKTAEETLDVLQNLGQK